MSRLANVCQGLRGVVNLSMSSFMSYVIKFNSQEIFNSSLTCLGRRKIDLRFPYQF